MTYILSAQLMAMTVIDLLADGAAKAEEILASFQPKMTRDGYIQFMESIGKK
jgi:hypothetical protein